MSELSTDCELQVQLKFKEKIYLYRSVFKTATVLLVYYQPHVADRGSLFQVEPLSSELPESPTFMGTKLVPEDLHQDRPESNQKISHEHRVQS